MIIHWKKSRTLKVVNLMFVQVLLIHESSTLKFGDSIDESSTGRIISNESNKSLNIGASGMVLSLIKDHR